MAGFVVTEFMDVVAIGPVRRDFDVLYDAERVDRRDELVAAAGEARIDRAQLRIDAAVLDAACDLRVVGRLGGGLDTIDGRRVGRGASRCARRQAPTPRLWPGP